MNIFTASQRGEVENIRDLIQSGRASASDRDPSNVTPLHWAAINARVEVCRYLLQQGAVVNALGGDLMGTPMQWAAVKGYVPVVQLLIECGADPNIVNLQGYNTLHLVTHSHSAEALRYILRQAVNVDSRDPDGHTSLMWAAYQGDELSVKILLEHGANVNAKSNNGLTVLHWAVVEGNPSCIRQLLEHGAETNTKDDEGRTAQDMAVELERLAAWGQALGGGRFRRRRSTASQCELKSSYLAIRASTNRIRRTPRSTSSYLRAIHGSRSVLTMQMREGPTILVLTRIHFE